MGFFVALRFLTVLPSPYRGDDPADLGRPVAYFPAVGLLLGLILAGLDQVLGRLLPRVAGDALLIGAMVFLTGALHLDGFMDSCDALFGGNTPEARLEVLKDPRVGAFGAAGGICLLLIKYAALLSLDPSIKPWALTIALGVGRWGMTYGIYAYPYRPGPGTGRSFKEKGGFRELVIATITVVGASFLVLRITGLVAILMGLLITIGIARFALGRLPGLSGDVYGAINEGVEASVLLFLAGAGSLR